MDRRIAKEMRIKRWTSSSRMPQVDLGTDHQGRNLLLRILLILMTPMMTAVMRKVKGRGKGENEE